MRDGPTRLSLSLGVVVVVVALASCTDPVDRVAPLQIVIDADGIVRANTVRVEITLEAQKTAGAQAGKTWDSVLVKTFEPDPTQDEDWPWRYTLETERSTFDYFKLSAIARDPQGAVVGSVKALRTRAEARRHDLRLRFDSACYRRMSCDKDFTCAGGLCVDATWIPKADGGDVTGIDAGDQPPMTIPGETREGVAAEGGTCKDGERACVQHGSQNPLLCMEGSWIAQSACADDERCVTADGAARGMCRPISDECRNRQPNVPYCDGETMLVCVDLVGSEMRACAENERCVSPDGVTARCTCRSGYVVTAGRCTRATDCGPEQGGCDALTTCNMENGQPVCSGCPSGHIGSGRDGCAPLLGDLQLSAGTLDPVLAPDVREYRVRVPLLWPRVTLTPSVPDGATVTLNGAPLGESTTWTSPVLPLLDETRVQLEVVSKSGVISSYDLVFERMGEQSAYLKQARAGIYDQFGSSLDIAGDTLVVSSWFEDSNATGVNGTPTNMNATDSGAVFVYGREGDGWKQQAYLKPDVTAMYDYFGTSVAFQGDTLIVGAIREGLFEGTTGTMRSGVAYVFSRVAGVWSQTQMLTGGGNRSDMFGASAEFEGDTLLIGAPWDSAQGEFSGAVYAYQRDGAMFRQAQKITSSKPAAHARFGSSLFLKGDELFVGAPDDPPPHARKGGAEVFARRNGSWTSTQFLQPTSLGGASNFGYSIAMHGDTLAISAPHTSAFPGSPTPTDPGELFVFERSGGSWMEAAHFRAPNARNTDWFGLQIAMMEDALIIGAPGDASGARGLDADATRSDAPFAGAAYVYTRNAEGAWSSAAYIKGNNTGVDDWFGRAVAVDGQTLVVSAMFENGGGGGEPSGAVYVFR